MGVKPYDEVDLDAWLAQQPPDVRTDIKELTSTEAAQAICDIGGAQFRRLAAAAGSIRYRPVGYVTLAATQLGQPYEDGESWAGTIRVLGTSLHGPVGNEAARRAWHFLVTLRVIADQDGGVVVAAADGDNYLIVRSAGRPDAPRRTLMTRYTGRLIAAMVMPRVRSQLGSETLMRRAGLRFPEGHQIRTQADFLAYFEGQS